LRGIGGNIFQLMYDLLDLLVDSLMLMNME
jgi:hypothetical protein